MIIVAIPFYSILIYSLMARLYVYSEFFNVQTNLVAKFLGQFHKKFNIRFRLFLPYWDPSFKCFALFNSNRILISW